MFFEKIIISLSIFFVIFVIYLILERKRNLNIPFIAKARFLILIIFSVFFFYPYLNIIEWIMWGIFLYTVFDDWNTKSVNILPLIGIGLIIVVTEQLWVMFAVLVVVLIIGALVLKKHPISLGMADFCAFVPLIMYFKVGALLIGVLSIALMYIFVFISKMRYKELPFFPVVAISIVLYVKLKVLVIPIFSFYLVLYVYVLIRKAFRS